MAVKLSKSMAKSLGITVAQNTKKKKGKTLKALSMKKLPAPPHSLRFSIPWRAVPKERARTVNSGGITFTPKRSEAFSKDVRRLIRQLMRGNGPFIDKIEIHVLFIFKTPASWPKWKKSAGLSGFIRPTARPDLDNIEKSIFDALNELAYEDDAIIVGKNAAKFFGEKDSIEMRIRPAPSNEWIFPD